MALLSHSLGIYSDGSVAEQAKLPPLWMHREDREVFGGIRSCAPCPAVMVVKDDPHALMSEQWQYYLRAINPGMTLENVYLLLDDRLAFANGTGFPTLDNPGEKADYLFRRNLGEKPPALDKVRTCSRNVLTGEVVGDRLRVLTFNSRANPPLKPGKSYPARVQDAKLDDYLYTPQAHPWLFVTANIVNRAGEVVQFPRGAVYPWAGSAPRSFLPLISNHAYGDVLCPLKNLVRVTAVPSPYRSN